MNTNNLTALVFPGQGSQHTGMSKSLFDNFPSSQEYYNIANEVLGFDIQHIMFNGSEEELKATKVTQPALFIHSLIAYFMHPELEFQAVAGHSLGEISALVAAKVIDFKAGLSLVKIRALAMQEDCELVPSGMAVVLGMSEPTIKELCQKISTEHQEILVPANFNSPDQIVISGTSKAIDLSIDIFKQAGAKRVLKLNVSGAFHSPLMNRAYIKVKDHINSIEFLPPIVPIYQNLNAQPQTNPQNIKENLMQQIISPVLWTHIIHNMIKNGFSHFIEVGAGKVLQGLIKKIDSTAETNHLF